MRVLIACVLAACGSSSTSPVTPANAVPATPPAEVAAADAPEDCASTIEDAKPGNHDRYAFETNDGSWGYRDSKGAIAIPPRLRFAYEFKPTGIAAAVDHDGTFVFIDTSGAVIARAYAFDNGPDYFQEGHARIVDARGKIGFIDDHGRITIAPRFDEAASFCHGVAAVSEGGRRFTIDAHGAPAPASP